MIAASSIVQRFTAYKVSSTTAATASATALGSCEHAPRGRNCEIVLQVETPKSKAGKVPRKTDDASYIFECHHRRPDLLYKPDLGASAPSQTCVDLDFTFLAKLSLRH